MTQRAKNAGRPEDLPFEKPKPKPKPKKTTMAERLEGIRKELGLSVVDFNAKLGQPVSAAQAHNYHRGKQKTSSTYLEAIQKTFPWINSRWLLGRGYRADLPAEVRHYYEHEEPYLDAIAATHPHEDDVLDILAPLPSWAQVTLYGLFYDLRAAVPDKMPDDRDAIAAWFLRWLPKSMALDGAHEFDWTARVSHHLEVADAIQRGF